MKKCANCSLIRKLEKRVAILTKHCATDFLTNLLNRRTMTKLIREEIEKFKRYHENFCVVFVDIDDLKHINDSIAWPAGDLIIKKVSRMIKKNIRSTDKAGRIGGDEFLILLLKTGKNQALDLAERIRISVEKNAVRYGEQKIKASVSIGIFEYDTEGIDLSAILRKADMAHKKAKGDGKNRTIQY